MRIMAAKITISSQLIWTYFAYSTHTRVRAQRSADVSRERSVSSIFEIVWVDFYFARKKKKLLFKNLS